MNPGCLGNTISTDVGKSSRKTVEKKTVSHALGIIQEDEKGFQRWKRTGNGWNMLMRMMTKSSRDCKPEVGGEPGSGGGKPGPWGLLRRNWQGCHREELETPRGKTQDTEHAVRSSDWKDMRKGADEPRRKRMWLEVARERGLSVGWYFLECRREGGRIRGVTGCLCLWPVWHDYVAVTGLKCLRGLSLPPRQVPLKPVQFSSFFRWGNRGTERLNYLFNIVELVSGIASFWTPSDSRVQACDSMLYILYQRGQPKKNWGDRSDQPESYGRVFKCL